MFIKRHFNAITRCIALILLLLIQLVLISGLSVWVHHNTVYTYILIEVIGMLSMLPLLSGNRNSSYKIYWMLIILLIPIGGHIIYALWGEEGIHHKKHARIRKRIEAANRFQKRDESVQKEIDTLAVSRYLNRQGYPAYENTKTDYISASEDTFAQIKRDCMAAQKFIFVSFFLIADGKVLEELKAILVDRAKHGVEVRIIYDDAGSMLKLSDHSLDELLALPNVKLKRFNSLQKNMLRQYLHYRNHQKIVIVDGNVAFTGAIGISDAYTNISNDLWHWKGSAVRMEGQGVWSLTLIFLGTWGAEQEDYVMYQPTINAVGGLCQPYADGPANNEDNIAKDVYFLMAADSRKFLYIMTPFLILEDEISEALCLAAKAGVDVRIITPGKTRKQIRKLMTEENYGNLLKAGVRIYEYKPGFIYAKLCLNDDSCKIGTVNMDFRSFYLHYECGTMIYHKDTREKVCQDFLETLGNSREITYGEWAARPWYRKLIQMFLKVVQCHF